MNVSPLQTRDYLTRWAFGLAAGTLLVWGTSPWFVRSYHSRVFDPVCHDWVYPASTQYRWRSEGYATTTIGVHGMPGRTNLPPSTTERVIALWGDSQAEGVCVADSDKLWSQLESEIAGSKNASFAVLPMARSGEDALDWTSRFARVEKQLGVTEHFVLICELEDLESLAESQSNADSNALAEAAIPGRTDIDVPVESLSVNAVPQWLDLVPDFVVHAARGLIFDGDTSQIRTLRFRPGPVASTAVTQSTQTSATVDPNQPPEAFPASVIARRLADATTNPITMIYAPQIPVVMGDRIIRSDAHDSQFRMLEAALAEQGITVIDCRDGLWGAAAQGHFPHGFNNGRIGSGHLNETGYRVIAAQVGAKAGSNSR
ncbi:hypothetical protein FHS27_004034 [Rhodopirellula rubra]|uniref:Uncharacterized protein n=1 Tax=Aporhodopirellula rubra TaxID=980271 RepID=A0A7W5H665_9BACT|nr:hypothetical protein [Aporhodopirellula rubra]MBB3208207.1 hypothetical protein [Aporhodopirellula rubra]